MTLDPIYLTGTCSVIHLAGIRLGGRGVTPSGGYDFNVDFNADFDAAPLD